jgi:hypothetical protein
MAHRVKKGTNAHSSLGSGGKAEIILVYNVDSGALPGLKDLSRRTLSPATNKCGLRAVTSGVLGTRRDWKAFVSGSDTPITVHYRDQFKEQYPKVNALYPAGFIKIGKKVEQFILSREIDDCDDVPCLERLIEKKLRAEMGQ